MVAAKNGSTTIQILDKQVRTIDNRLLITLPTQAGTEQTIAGVCSNG